MVFSRKLWGVLCSEQCRTQCFDALPVDTEIIIAGSRRGAVDQPGAVRVGTETLPELAELRCQ